MFNPYKYKQRPTVDGVTRIDCTALIRKFLQERASKYDADLAKLFVIRTEEDAIRLRDELNHGIPYYQSLHVPVHDTALQFDFVKSNLDKGFIFYFVCTSCERRVKYLYQLIDGSELRCRSCHQLTYTRKKQGNNTDKEVRHLLRNPQALVMYLQSIPQHSAIAERALETIISFTSNKG